MAVTATITGFMGLSSDAKPNGQPGQTFIESDTNKIYIWNNALWSGILTSALNELQQLAAASIAGNLILVNGSNATATTAITSYTPATGKTFVFVKSTFSLPLASASYGSGAFDVLQRNNVTTVDKKGYNVVTTANTITLTPTNELMEFKTAKGDTLAGNSSKVYDIFLNGTTITGAVAATLAGYIQ